MKLRTSDEDGELKREFGAFLSCEDGDQLVAALAEYIQTRGIWVSREAREKLLEAIDACGA